MKTHQFIPFGSRFSRRVNRNEDGYILAATLAVIAIVSILTAAVFALANSQTRSAAVWRDRMEAFYAAESGINEFLYRFKELGEKNPAQFNSPPGTPGEGSSYSVQVEKTAATTFVLTSTGYKNGSQRQIRIVLEDTSDSGVFTHNDPDHIIVSTDPADPDYFDPGYEAPELIFPVEQAPLELGSPSPFTVSNNNPTTLAPGDYNFSSFTLEGRAELTIEGPANVYISGPMSLGNYASLTTNGDVNFYLTGSLDTGNNALLAFNGPTTFFMSGSLTTGTDTQIISAERTDFYIQGDLLIKNLSTIGMEQANRLLFWLSTDASHLVDLRQNTALTFGLYAPTAEVALGDNLNFTGAIVAGTTSLQNSSQVSLNYQEDTFPITSEFISGGSGTISFALLSWGDI